MLTKLIIFESEKEYHCVVFLKKIPEHLIDNKNIVYRDEKIVPEEDRSEKRKMIREMRSKAKEWAREQGIEFVYNLDSGYFV